MSDWRYPDDGLSEGLGRHWGIRYRADKAGNPNCEVTSGATVLLWDHTGRPLLTDDRRKPIGFRRQETR